MCQTLKNILNKSAHELLCEYKIKFKPPIDIGKLLKRIGISTVEVDFTKIEKVEGYSVQGVSFTDADSLYILYKRGASYNRQLLSIAYELGYCVFSDNFCINHIRKYGEEDKQIMQFVGELLVPETALMPIYKRFTIPSLSRLSKIFGVSTALMATRLNALELNYYKDTQLSDM